MKILQTSIIPALSLLSLAFLSTVHADSDAVAVQEYTGSNHNVAITGTAGTLTGTSAFGLRFSGTSGVAVNNNIVINSGTISSGAGAASVLSGDWISNGGSSDSVSSAIVFDGSNGGQVNGNIFTNSGNLIAEANSDFVAGVLIVSSSNANNNTISNSGSIKVKNSSDDNPNGYVYGIELRSGSGSLNNNTINNSGDIVVSASGDGRDATGIELGLETGSVSNNTISNTGNLVISGSGEDADISGIWVSSGSGSVSNNTISNSGSIALSTIGGGGAWGITIASEASTDVSNNTINNSGSFKVNADGDGAEADGISISLDSDADSNVTYNTITNSGSLAVSSSGSNPQAFGIWLSSGSGSVSSNTIANSGSFAVSASGNDANAVGIALGSDLCNVVSNNTISNSGSLKISASGDDSVTYGIALDSGSRIVNNTINNTGSFVVSASGNGALGGGILVVGIDSSSVSNNTINNTGSLIVSASGSNSFAFGIVLGSGTSGEMNTASDFGQFLLSGTGRISNNTINNYGTITVSGSSATAILIAGISSGNVINNYGTITSSGTAINIVNGSNNVINLRGYSVVNGLIAASGTNNVLNIAFSGLSAKASAALRAELTAEGALSGTASSGSFTVRGVTYTYDPLIVTLSTSASSYEAQGKTPNQKAIGANLDSFTVIPTGNMLKLLDALDQSGNVANGLEQLSPQRYQVYGDIALSNANLLTQEVDQRLNNVRSGSEGIDTSALGVSYGSAQSKLGMGSNGLPSVAAFKDGKTPIEQAAEPKRWGAFLSGDIVFANVDGRGELQDSNFTNSGLIGGVDAKLTDALTTGVLLGYNHSDIDLDSQNSNANVDAYSAGLYSGYHEGNFYGNGLAAFTRNNYESDRNIDFPGYSQSANGRTAGSQYTVDLDGGYDHPVSKDLSVGPFAGLQYVHLGVNSFTESGAEGANLALNDQSLDSLRSRVGVRMELRKEITPSWKVASEVSLAWQHEFANNDRAIVAQFSGSGLSPFTVRTSDPERDAALIGLGFNATYKDSLTTFVDYSMQAGQSHYVEQTVKGGFKWSF